MNKIYSWRTKPGSSAIMASALKFPEQVDNRMDDRICRITEISYTIEKNVKPAYQEKYMYEKLYQIKVLDINDKEFLIFESLIVTEEPVVLRDE